SVVGGTAVAAWWAQSGHAALSQPESATAARPSAFSGIRSNTEALRAISGRAALSLPEPATAARPSELAGAGSNTEGLRALLGRTAPSVPEPATVGKIYQSTVTNEYCISFVSGACSRCNYYFGECMVDSEKPIM